MHVKQKLIAIVGPTASGKSELAIFLARRIKKYRFSGYKGAEIISTDSRQVYKFLDVGTNKVTPLRGGHPALDAGSIAKKWIPDQARNDRVRTYKSIPHHCIDFVHPRHTFTVAEYKACAEKAIKKITQRDNIPILVGGTGFYVQAVVDGLVLPEVPPNQKLRAVLQKKTTEQLFRILQKLDPERAMRIDTKNPRRLIRAIEIVKATGKQLPKLAVQKRFKTLFLGIIKSNAELKRAIERRSKKQIPGLLKEIQLLLKMKVPQKRIRELGFEYKLGLQYMQSVMPDLPTGRQARQAGLIRHPGNKKNGSRVKHGMTKSSLAEQLTKENWRYAKRQMTWFKRDKRVEWIKYRNEAFSLVKKFLRNRKS